MATLSPKATELTAKVKQTVDVLHKQIGTINTPEMTTATEALEAALQEVYTVIEGVK